MIGEFSSNPTVKEPLKITDVVDAVRRLSGIHDTLISTHYEQQMHLPKAERTEPHELLGRVAAKITKLTEKDLGYMAKRHYLNSDGQIVAEMPAPLSITE